MEPSAVTNGLADLLGKGGYGLAAVGFSVAGYLFRRLDAERDKVEAILKAIIPLTDKLPEAVAKLHEATDRLERLAERKSP